MRDKSQLHRLDPPRCANCRPRHPIRPWWLQPSYVTLRLI